MSNQRTKVSLTSPMAWLPSLPSHASRQLKSSFPAKLLPRISTNSLKRSTSGARIRLGAHQSVTHVCIAKRDATRERSLESSLQRRSTPVLKQSPFVRTAQTSWKGVRNIGDKLSNHAPHPLHERLGHLSAKGLYGILLQNAHVHDQHALGDIPHQDALECVQQH